MNRVAEVDYGALVVSLDFELYWGVRDVYPADGGSYRENLMGVREVIPEILSLFTRFRVAATWATVGLLLASSVHDVQPYIPRALPEYADSTLSPYPELSELSGDDRDPIRFAPELVELIQKTPRQEIGTHTFSHFYCLEPGQTKSGFQADLESAIAIAESKGIGRIRSIVFPRNQFNQAYADVLSDAGITCCRTNSRGWFHREMASDRYFRVDVRGSRLLDSYLPVSGTQMVRWSALSSVRGVCCLPASHYLRPYSPRLRHLERLKLRRLTGDLDVAAKSNGILHLWWHPENFGRYPRENLQLLSNVLEAFAERRERYGFQSFSMAEVAAVHARIDSRQESSTANIGDR